MSISFAYASSSNQHYRHVPRCSKANMPMCRSQWAVKLLYRAGEAAVPEPKPGMTPASHIRENVIVFPVHHLLDLRGYPTTAQSNR